MTDIPFKRGVAYTCYTPVVSRANSAVFQTNPTIAAGDFRVSIDGGALNNLTTLPVVSPAGSKQIKIALSAAEMTGGIITVIASDQAGAEWADWSTQLATGPVPISQIDDEVYNKIMSG